MKKKDDPAIAVVPTTQKPPTRANARDTRGPRLTREELIAWSHLKAAAWSSFKEAWMARGLRMPPTPAQRELLWEIADARPTDLARWVRAAPTPKADEIVAYVIERWELLRSAIDEALEADELTRLELLAEDRAAAKRVMTRIGEML
jgi:hypothetical protein